MVRFFLEAKHWQVFFISIALPYLILVTAITFNWSNIEFDLLLNILPIVIAIFLGGIFGWLWAVGISIHDILPKNQKMNIGRFKIFLGLVLIYVIVFFTVVGYFVAGGYKTGPDPSVGVFAVALGLAVPLHLFSFFGMLYCIYFISKALKTAQLKREAKFLDYYAEYLLICLFPVGIWFIQPKVNKLFEIG